MKLYPIALLCIFLSTQLFSQNQVQNIRGKIVDKEMRIELPGVNVFLITDTNNIISVTSASDGSFRLTNVPVGRHKIRITFVGYLEVVLQNIIVDAGKETILFIEMEESVSQLNEVVITDKKKGDANNDMSSVSSKSFSMEETNRYAGSRGDAARMARSFAGVNVSDDSRNDISIRGNSPMGLLYKIEGIDIPNPNHFAVAGTSGGAISILNNKIFGNSDFMTGAFPAEYGNATAGVFDIRLRNGNNEKHEFTGQFGLLGTEINAEGPLNKSKGSTYLVNYRYSTLKIFESVNFNIGTSATPAYQDGSFKLNFPLKKASNLSLFAIGGTSNINIVLSDKPLSEVEIYGDNNRDQKFSTSLGIAGITFSKSINEKTFLKTTFAAYGTNANAQHEIFTRDSVFAVDSIYPKMRYEFINGRYSCNLQLTKKINTKHAIKTGLLVDYHNFNFIDSNFVELSGKWDRRLNYNGSAVMTQLYTQWKYKYSDLLSFNIGIHAQHLDFNNSIALEPRFGVKYLLPKDQSLGFGYGMHSQTLPWYIYFHQKTDSNNLSTLHNINVDFTKAHHVVLSYVKSFSSTFRIMVETYYQYLYNIPVDTFKSSFSLLNQGSTFSRFFPNKMANIGTGNNYGIDLTVEKLFDKSYFFLFTASLYKSEYTGSDKIKRSTDYNGKYILNTIGGKEIKLKAKNDIKLLLSSNILYAGGKLYSPADTTASAIAGEYVAVDSLRNSLRFKNFFRTDLKLGIKINTSKLTHELAFDFINLFNTKNILGLTYAPDPKNPSSNPIRMEYQLGFFPVFYYKIDF